MGSKPILIQNAFDFQYDLAGRDRPDHKSILEFLSDEKAANYVVGHAFGRKFWLRRQSDEYKFVHDRRNQRESDSQLEHCSVRSDKRGNGRKFQRREYEPAERYDHESAGDCKADDVPRT